MSIYMYDHHAVKAAGQVIYLFIFVPILNRDNLLLVLDEMGSLDAWSIACHLKLSMPNFLRLTPQNSLGH